MANLNTNDFVEPGLYLLWPDGKRLTLTRAFIQEQTTAMLQSNDRIPPAVRAATAYKPCDICPEREKAVICHAIMPVLPFFEHVHRYFSYERVTAIYRDPDHQILTVVDTTMQEALKYIALLSLTQYCEVGRQYAAYFVGVNPLLPPPHIAGVVYRNLFLAAGGRQTDVQAILQKMRSELLTVVRCQMDRLRLICAQDALLNAFVATYNITELLFSEMEARV